MVGERTRATYRLGDEATVILVRANVAERNLDFVLKDNGVYDPESMQRENAKKSTPRGDRGKGHDDKKSGKRGGKSSTSDIIAHDVYDEGASSHKKRSRSKKRGASGEKKSVSQPQQLDRKQTRRAAKPLDIDGLSAELGIGKKKKSRPSKDERAAKKAVKNLPRSERSSRGDSRDGKKDGDYHRVRVTGLNSAVWPDPPGYHERKEREEARAAERGSGRRSRPRPHRKTEGGTRDNK